MGRRGPLTGAQHGLPTGRRPAGLPSEVNANGISEPPEPPDTLGPTGRAVWDGVWRGLPDGVGDVELDRLTIQRLAELVEQRELFHAAIVEHGALLVEPVVTPKGEVVGERRYLNPAEPALRRLDRELTALGDRLGLSPAARARLGLIVTQAGRQQAEIDHVLANQYRRHPAEEDG